MVVLHTFQIHFFGKYSGFLEKDRFNRKQYENTDWQKFNSA
jgi:hypothetical protein